MNRDKLTKNVLDAMRRIKEEQGIDILHLPDKELDKWIECLVRECWE